MSAGLTVALAGNPNSGKTTIFNNITGARQHVGNYPGVTVERREGTRRYNDKDILVVDLPGTYSLTANSLDEVIARNVIIDEKPDIIVNVLDASNLERNLYLTVQLLELERPMVLALNMSDVAKDMGMSWDNQELSHKLGIPVVNLVGNRNKGTDELLKTVAEASANSKHQPFVINYGEAIEAEINQLSAALKDLTNIKYPTRWLAIRLLENDQDVRLAIENMTSGPKVVSTADTARQDLITQFGDDLDVVFAEKRYQFVGSLYQDIIQSQSSKKHTTSDIIDSVLTNRILGLPIFLAIMWLLFNMVFTIGAYPQEWIEQGIGLLGEAVAANMPDGDFKSLIVDGIIGGVGGVLVFLPNIVILFLGIALLEDTGYMTRAAFVMDRIMRAVGLHGKSFIPLLIGFGCSVPAIMGARTLENPRDRMITILVAPLMSCSARLPVYTLLSAAFFADNVAGTVLFSIYLIGIILAFAMAMIFRKWLFPGSTEPYVMEMPPYHLPTLRSILMHMWERSVLYLQKAGTLILAASILIWFLTNYPSDVSYSQDYDQAKTAVNQSFEDVVSTKILAPLGIASLEQNTELQTTIDQIQTIKADFAATTAEAEETDAADLEAEMTGKIAAIEQAQPAVYQFAIEYVDLSDKRDDDLAQLEKQEAGEKLSGSYAGMIGKFVEPVISPLGFDWKIGVGLISAVAAKEVLVSTLGTIYSVGDIEDDATALQDAVVADPAFSPLVAFSLMVFTLLYSPCLAALAVIKRETNSWNWTAFTFAYSTVLAWVISFMIYQIGTFLGY